MSDRIRAAATILAVSSAALMHAELNRNASATAGSRRQMPAESGTCPVFSADGHAIGILKSLAPCGSLPERLIVRLSQGVVADLSAEVSLDAEGTFDRRGRFVVPLTVSELAEVAARAPA